MKAVEAKKKLSGARHRNRKPSPRLRRFSTLEVCYLLDISKATLFRWEREGRILTPPRDWRNWRLYTATNLEEIKRIIRKRTSS
ncbi:MAG: MerR family transcriptional regulator [Nitrospiraceae bacterium]|nr:MAG: MerR family transcriptional regulator [Nitrospiraceae bacterium]